MPAAGWPALSVRETIVDPKKLVGQGFRLSAVVKQITRVPLDENDRGTQLGLKQYYLLHALVQLDKPIRLKVSDTENLTYGQQYPVVIAATTLPNRWTASENMRRWVDAKCLFAKSWTYQSAKTIDSSASQWSPLLIGVQLNETTAPQSSDTSWPVGWLLLIPVGLATLGLLVAGISGFRR